MTIDIGTKVEGLSLSCDYAKTLTVESNYKANSSENVIQDGAISGSSNFDDIFFINLHEFNETNNATYISDGVVVGQELQVSLDLLKFYYLF